MPQELGYQREQQKSLDFCCSWTEAAVRAEIPHFYPSPTSNDLA